MILRGFGITQFSVGMNIRLSAMSGRFGKQSVMSRPILAVPVRVTRSDPAIGSIQPDPMFCFSVYPTDVLLSCVFCTSGWMPNSTFDGAILAKRVT